MILLTSVRYGQTMTAYHCDSRNLRYTTVSLVDLPECEIKRANTIMDSERGYLIQKSKTMEIDIHKCSVRFHRFIHNCDILGASEAVTNDDLEYPIRLTREECHQLIKYHRYENSKGTKFEDLSAARENVKSDTIAGETDFRGKCSGGEWKDTFGEWTNVVVNARYHIKFYKTKATLDIGNNKIKLASGIVCSMTAENCVDLDEANVFWNLENLANCWNRGVSILYEGPTFRVQEMNEKNESYNYVFINQTEKVISIKLKEQLSVCGIRAYNTLVPEVIYIPWHDKDFSLYNLLQVREQDVNIQLHMLSQMNGIDVHIDGEMTRMYDEIRYNECKLEQRTLKIYMHLGFISPLEFAYIYNEGPGATAVLAGQAIYIAVCPEVSVRMRETEECYVDIPVFMGNQSAFMNIRNRIIQSESVRIPCSGIMSTMINISGKWYKINPQVHEVSSPQVIPSDLKTSWRYRHFDRLLESGIYTQEQLDEAHQRLYHNYEVEAAAGAFENLLIQSNIHKGGLNMSAVFESWSIKRMIKKEVDWVWEKATWLGQISEGLVGIFIIYEVISTFLAVITNAFLIHREYGFNWVMFTATFGGLASAAVHLRHRAHIREMRDKVLCKEKYRERDETRI